MRISDWSSDVCSSDLRTPAARLRPLRGAAAPVRRGAARTRRAGDVRALPRRSRGRALTALAAPCFCRSGFSRELLAGLRRKGSRLKPLLQRHRSEEHTSELQSLMRISYAVFWLNKKQLN